MKNGLYEKKPLADGENLQCEMLVYSRYQPERQCARGAIYRVPEASSFALCSQHAWQLQEVIQPDEAAGALVTVGADGHRVAVT